MKGIELRIPDSAVDALEQETDYPIPGAYLYENDIEQVLVEWRDDDDSILPREHVEILQQTHTMPVASLEAFSTMFHNIGVGWTEEAMREQGIGEPTDESRNAYAVADAWYAVAKDVDNVRGVLGRLVDIQTIVSYDTNKLA